MPTNPVPLPADPIAQIPKPAKGALRTVQDVIAWLSKTDDRTGRITGPWNDYLTNQEAQVSASLVSVNSVSLTDQTASIGATDMSGGGLAAGLYQMAAYAAISQPAGTSSSLTITIGWTYRGVSQTYVAAAITGNLVTSVQPNTALLLSVDANSPITYAAAYVSVGAPVMKYDLAVTLRRAGS